MNERIQRALDGELPRESLSPAERDELDAWEEASATALAGLRAETAPDVAREVMDRVAGLPRHGAPVRDPAWKRAMAWVWTPRRVAVRPAWALAAAALAAILFLAPLRDDVPATPLAGPPAAAAPAPGRVFVHFRLDAPDARTVQLAADFTEWRPEYALNETAPGVWTVVVAVEPGVHQYAFVVDGDRWVSDPLAPGVDDGFGGTNSRLDVMTPEPAPGTAL